ncbi:hypothetical protein HDV00_002454 [Rhizophlyctis rosea]|nr:hypothetical protein HDV00_002454 [Rhizophlyctis rosea]
MSIASNFRRVQPLYRASATTAALPAPGPLIPADIYNRYSLAVEAADPDFVDSFCASLFANEGGEWAADVDEVFCDTEFVDHQGVPQTTALLQVGVWRVGVAGNGHTFEILLAQIGRMHVIPSNVNRLINDPRVLKVFHDGNGDKIKLEQIRDPQSGARLRMRGGINISRILAAALEYTGHPNEARTIRNGISLKDMVSMITGWTMSASPGGPWNRLDLTLAQTRYASYDVFALMILMFIAKRRVITQDGQLAGVQVFDGFISDEMECTSGGRNL